MRFIASIILSLCVLAFPYFGRAQTDQSENYRFVVQFIETLGTLERVRDLGETSNDGDIESVLNSCVRNFETAKLELGGQIFAVKSFHLTGLSKDAPSSLQGLLETQRDLFGQFQNICAASMGGQREGVDYAALSAEMAKVSARIQYFQKAVLIFAPLAFSVLIREQPDEQNHMSHLSISRQQMNTLAQSIKDEFGKKFDMKNPSYPVAAGRVLYTLLLKKGYKGSDEP